MTNPDPQPGMHFAAVFVTTELYPFTRGGIGVLYGNLLKTYAAEDAPILVVNASMTEFSQDQFADHYRHARLVNVLDVLRNTSILPESAFERTARWHYLGYLALEALLRLRRRGLSWDVVEFQDFGGLAAATLLARSCHPELRNAEIAVRVHGPEGVLRRFNPRAPWRVHAVVMDLERQAFALADRVVGHSAEVLTEVEKAYSLSLVARSVVQDPPVGQVNGMSAHSGSGKHVPRALFASKVDIVKAPEIFLDAARILHARRAPMRCVLMADRLAEDSSWGLSMDRLHAPHSGVEWMPKVTEEERRQYLSESLVVISSPFEAFCLLAYETAMLGGRPVLSSANPAFSDSSVWTHGVNCWKFDGTAADLARVLIAHANDALAAPLQWAHTPMPYWRCAESSADLVPGPSAARDEERPERARLPSIGVVVTNRDLERFAATCISSLLTQVRRPDVVVLVDDGSRSQAALEPSQRMLEAAHFDVRVVRHRAPLGLSEARNSGLALLETDYVVFLDMDDALDVRFLERAETALESSNADVYVPFVGCFVDEADHLVGSNQHVLAFLGATWHTRYSENLMSSAVALVRRRSLPSLAFDSRFALYEDWDLWCRMSEQGAHFVVDPQIGLWYRQREGGMAAEARRSSRAALALDQLRTAAVRRGQGLIPATAMTDFAHMSIAPMPPPDRAGHTLRLDERSELLRLRAVEAEAAVIFSRKIVRLAMKLADARHRRRRRASLSRASVFNGAAAEVASRTEMTE